MKHARAQSPTHFSETKKAIIEISESTVDSVKKGAEEKSKAAITESILETTDFLSNAKKGFGKSGKAVKTKLSKTGNDLKEDAAEINRKSGGFLSKSGDKLSCKAKHARKSVEETKDSTKTAFAATEYQAKQKK